MSLWPYLVRARSLTGFSELVRSHAGDPEALLRAEGLSLGLLDAPDETFPLASAKRPWPGGCACVAARADLSNALAHWCQNRRHRRSQLRKIR